MSTDLLYYDLDDTDIPIDRGLVNCDFGYLVLFDKSDHLSLSKFCEKVRYARATNDTISRHKLIDKYEKYLYRSYNDQTVNYNDNNSGLVEPLQISFKKDRVVFSGLERLADLATGKSDFTFNYYAIGTGPSPVLPSDTALDFEEARVSIVETGFAESKGSSMVFAASFPTTLPSMSVTESGIFDRYNAPSTMFLRTTYTGANILTHIFNQTFVACSHFVYQLSI